MSREEGKDIRIAALKTAAVAKQQRAAEGLEKAIDKLIQSNESMSFANVAREAGVSISYLYKYPRVKARILELRNQQQQVGKPNKPQTASDASKTVIITELRERIKKLEADLIGLRKANEGMAGRLYQLQDMQSMVERLKVENEGLKQQIIEQGKIPEDVGSILFPIAMLRQLVKDLNQSLVKQLKPS